MTMSHFASPVAIALFSALAVSARAAATEPPAPAVAPATQPALIQAAHTRRDPNQMVCKREELSGSRLLGQKICHTPADWDIVTRNSRDMIETIQRKSKIGGGM